MGSMERKFQYDKQMLNIYHLTKKYAQVIMTNATEVLE